MKPLTRRRFLKTTTVLTSGMVLSGVNLIIPKPGRGADSEFLRTNCGMNTPPGEKVLIAYASMHGSTGEVADAVAKDLCAAGASVDVRPVETVTDLGPYRAVVVGSAIRSDAWLPQAKDFVANNRNVLSTLPTAYFLTCLTLAKPSEQTRRKAQSFLYPVLEDIPEVRPVCTGLFAGVLDYGKYSPAIKTVMKYKMWKNGIEEGDYRDWQMIHGFADQLKAELL